MGVSRYINNNNINNTSFISKKVVADGSFTRRRSASGNVSETWKDKETPGEIDNSWTQQFHPNLWIVQHDKKRHLLNSQTSCSHQKSIYQLKNKLHYQLEFSGTFLGCPTSPHMKSAVQSLNQRAISSWRSAEKMNKNTLLSRKPVGHENSCILAFWDLCWFYALNVVHFADWNDIKWWSSKLLPKPLNSNLKK